MIKAIETVYNGYRFRSRLEARWAVFFDALGVKYEYEPEGFELPSGQWYLPDFRVKCYGTRGDCVRKTEPSNLCVSCTYGYHFDDPYAYEQDCKYAKNVECSDNNGGCGKCDNYKHAAFDLYIEVKGEMTDEDASKVIEFAGSPFTPSGEYSERLLDEMNPILVVGKIPDENCATDSASLGVYDKMNGTDVYPFNYEYIDGDYFGAYPAATHDGRFYLFGDDSSYISVHDLDAVERAYRIARQARFEHGETPTPDSIRNEMVRRTA